jgi:hypothetical protein
MLLSVDIYIYIYIYVHVHPDTKSCPIVFFRFYLVLHGEYNHAIRSI